MNRTATPGSPKVALVTGGASGIGRATAARLADAGFSVVATDIDPAGQQAVAAIADAVFVEHDVTDESSWERAIATVLDLHGRLDVLVNNAGISYVRAVTDTTLADWRALMAVNVDGVFLGTKHGVRAMRRHGEGGSIVNVSSASGLIGSPFSSAYCASKGAVRLFTKAVALECAAEAIRVNSVHPGAVRTPIWGKVGVSPELEAAVGAASPLGRMAEPEEVADAIVYLASDASRYITGSELVIDGGVTAGIPRPLPTTDIDAPSTP
jgi:3(or 17)beta-hydroxysteroid dehydrogenase